MQKLFLHFGQTKGINCAVLQPLNWHTFLVEVEVDVPGSGHPSLICLFTRILGSSSLFIGTILPHTGHIVVWKSFLSVDSFSQWWFSGFQCSWQKTCLQYSQVNGRKFIIYLHYLFIILRFYQVACILLNNIAFLNQEIPSYYLYYFYYFIIGVNI
jgi:hypothetical protein